MAKTNNGKAAEQAVREALKGINLPCFDWQRMYDATSARNAMMAQTGDFQWFLPGRHGVLEVKSTQHEYRLGKGAFSDLQRAKLRQRQAAGGEVWVLIHHYTAGVWRRVPFAECVETFDTRGQASLDLQGYTTYGSALEAVAAILMEYQDALR